MSYLFIVKISLVQKELNVPHLDEWAFSLFHCEGRLDYSIDEQRVDEILGKDAYCGGEIPEQILEKIEEANQNLEEVSYYWENEKGAQDFVEFLEEKGFKAQTEKIEKEDWNKNWRGSFETIVVSESLKVVPSWEKSQDSLNDLYIYPGMGFGTGNHETTFLCLKAFEEHLDEFEDGLRCLDFGCGSGILGIAAVKKKKAIVDFVDIDTDALDNCVMNLEHNDFQNYSEGHAIKLRDRFQIEEPYPLVFANILESVLILEKDLILKALDERGLLIVSGLLRDQEDNILKEYSVLKHEKTLSKGDWIAIVFRK